MDARRVQAIAEALLAGECWNSSVAGDVFAETTGKFGVIEGCEVDDSSSGDAEASTEGSSATARGFEL